MTLPRDQEGLNDRVKWLVEIPFPEQDSVGWKPVNKSCVWISRGGAVGIKVWGILSTPYGVSNLPGRADC